MAGVSHNYRIHDREEHPERYCTDTADDGSPCLQYRVKGRVKCRMHGGRGGRPATTGEYTQTAQELWAVPPDVAEAFLRNVIHPDNLALYRQIALLNAQIDRRHRQMEEWGPPEAWSKRLKYDEAVLELVHTMMACTDADALMAATQELSGIAQKQLEADRNGYRYERAEQDVRNIIERLRKLHDSEWKRRLATDQPITAQQLRAVIALVITSIERNVSNLEERHKVFSDLRRYTAIGHRNVGPAALPAGGGEGE